MAYKKNGIIKSKMEFYDYYLILQELNPLALKAVMKQVVTKNAADYDTINVIKTVADQELDKNEHNKVFCSYERS